MESEREGREGDNVTTAIIFLLSVVLQFLLLLLLLRASALSDTFSDFSNEDFELFSLEDSVRSEGGLDSFFS
jgi:hypothetical protein